jgi:hypothetical protein
MKESNLDFFSGSLIIFDGRDISALYFKDGWNCQQVDLWSPVWIPMGFQNMSFKINWPKLRFLLLFQKGIFYSTVEDLSEMLQLTRNNSKKTFRGKGDCSWIVLVVICETDRSCSYRKNDLGCLRIWYVFHWAFSLHVSGWMRNRKSGSNRTCWVADNYDQIRELIAFPLFPVLIRHSLVIELFLCAWMEKFSNQSLKLPCYV